MSKEELKIPPVFECFAKFVNLDGSRVEIIPTHSYIAENGRVEFTFKVPNSYFGEQSKQIADLEAKLAESEEKYNATNRAYWELVEKQDNAFLQYEKLIGENQQLKQQLAEEEKEIERWHNNYKQRDRQFQSVRQRYHLLNRLQAKYHDKHKLHLSEMQCLELVEENKKLQQDKISFALEQLEKVKGYFGELSLYEMYDKIDNQIKQLKEME